MAILRLSTCNLFPENGTYWASRQPNEKEKETRVERMVMVGQNGVYICNLPFTEDVDFLCLALSTFFHEHVVLANDHPLS